MLIEFLKYPFKVGSANLEEWGLQNPKLFEQIEIYPETNMHYSQPQTNEEINPFNAKDVIIPKMFVTKIKGGKCFTKNGLVSTPDNKPLNDFTPIDVHPLANKRHYKFQNAEKINGSVTILTNDSCQKNYYHWLIESASRIHLIEKSSFKVDKYIINNECAYQKRILELLGILEEQIINIEPNRLIQADELVIPSIVNYFESVQTETRNYYNAKFITPWTIEFYREKFLPFIKETEPKKIYISREKSPYRRVSNEDEVINYLSEQGYKSYLLEDLAFLEQVELFYNASHVISVHGAGLTNVMFCQKEAKVLEIFDPGYLYKGQQMIAQTLDLDYSWLYADTHTIHCPGFIPVKINLDKLYRWSNENVGTC